MSRTVQREDALLVAIRTEGAIILPKLLRDRLDLRPGDLLEIKVQGKDIVLHRRPAGRLILRGVNASSQKTIAGAVRLGGDSVKDKKRLYER
jgi:AbrB family looped-hinge helix DNA binding protein